MSLRIGVDVGGTFTDFVCFDDASGQLMLLKEPSTPNDPSDAVLRGTQTLLGKFGLRPESVTFFIHGTTVATNTLLEHKGSRVALLVTQGFRDVLQINRQDRPRMYDYSIPRVPPLVPRHLRFEVVERLLHTGFVHTSLAEGSARQAIENIRTAQVLDVAVCLLHSYANPTHEIQLNNWLKKAIPEVRVSLSSEILPEFKEFERMSTTVVNAYVLPKVSNYVERLEGGLKDMSIRCSPQIMQSNGGLMSAETAQKHSVHTILSGPAAGALAGLRLAQQTGVSNMISIDVGGTSADVALSHGGKLHFAEENEIGGYVVKIPSIEIQTVGAGGGSIAWVDPGGALQVGPQSSGAEPGPACYARGGAQPTVTDANVALRRIAPEFFLGGRMFLDRGLACKSIQERIAEPLHLSLEESCEGILQVVNAVMAKTIRRLSVERGHDPRDFVLVAFGGAGPLQAIDLSIDLRIPRVLIPPSPGVSSALGLITADFRHDYARTLLWKTARHTEKEFNSQWDGLRTRAITQMLSEGIPANSIILLAQAEMRYDGQGYCLGVDYDLRSPSDSFSQLDHRFHRLHHSNFGYSDETAPTEIVNIRLTAIGQMTRPEFPKLPIGDRDASEALKGRRLVFFRGDWKEINVYCRTNLKSGNVIHGPAVIEQFDSTTFLYAEQEAIVDPFGNLLIEITA